MRIVTDSRPMEEPKEPEGDHLFQLYSLFADDAERERDGGDSTAAADSVTAK